MPTREPPARNLEPNSIRPTKRRAPTVPARAQAHAGAQIANGVPAATNSAPAPRALRSAPARRVSADAPTETVPEDVLRRFVQVGHTYYFPDGAHAFTDRGKRLTTPSENTEVIRSLVTIAQ